METLDLARFHERALIVLLTGCPVHTRRPMIRRAGLFFAEAITPIEQTHRAARKVNARLSGMIETLRRRSVDLASSNRHLQREIIKRQGIEKSLRKSEQHYGRLLEQSRDMQRQLHQLSRQLLSAQEEERKKISRELHDEIAQTLTGINIQLAELKTAAMGNTASLQQKIARTQRLVAKSVGIVHRFARELRPAVLDDLGLFPALHSFMKDFTKRTGIHIHFTSYASAWIEQLNNSTRTVLYRVTQEALVNVAKHAQADRATVTLRKLPGAVRLEITNNGKSFQVQQALQSKGNKCLGLLGMRERVEMIGGRFSVESTPRKGTTIRAQIPLRKGKRGAKR